MGIFDKAKEALNNEQHTDAALDKMEDLAKGKFGEDKADQVNKVREQLDNRLGETNQAANQEPEQEK